ncbi:hypothetical protein ACT453_62265, partial [Bacillus sp. D-CC]
IELVSFRGSDLSGGEDMNIVQGSSLPEMKSAQQDRIMTLWDKGNTFAIGGTLSFFSYTKFHYCNTKKK